MEELKAMYRLIDDFENDYTTKQIQWLSQQLRAYKEAGDPKKFFDGNINDYLNYLNDDNVLNDKNLKKWLVAHLFGPGG